MIITYGPYYDDGEDDDESLLEAGLPLSFQSPDQ